MNVKTASLPQKWKSRMKVKTMGNANLKHSPIGHHC